MRSIKKKKKKILFTSLYISVDGDSLGCEYILMNHTERPQHIFNDAVYTKRKRKFSKPYQSKLFKHVTWLLYTGFLIDEVSYRESYLCAFISSTVQLVELTSSISQHSSIQHPCRNTIQHICITFSSFTSTEHNPAIKLISYEDFSTQENKNGFLTTTNTFLL